VLYYTLIKSIARRIVRTGNIALACSGHINTSSSNNVNASPKYVMSAETTTRTRNSINVIKEGVD